MDLRTVAIGCTSWEERGRWRRSLKLLGIIGTALAVFLLAGRLVLVAGVTWTAWSFTNFLTELWGRHAEKTETTFDDMIVPMVRKTLKLIIIVWAIIYVVRRSDVTSA